MNSLAKGHSPQLGPTAHYDVKNYPFARFNLAIYVRLKKQFLPYQPLAITWLSCLSGFRDHRHRCTREQGGDGREDGGGGGEGEEGRGGE